MKEYIVTKKAVNVKLKDLPTVSGRLVCPATRASLTYSLRELPPEGYDVSFVAPSENLGNMDEKATAYFSRLDNNAEGEKDANTLDGYIMLFQTASRIVQKSTHDEDLQSRRKAMETMKGKIDDSKRPSKIRAVGTPRKGDTLEQKIWDIVHQSIEDPETEQLFTDAIKEKLDEYGIVPNRVELQVKTDKGVQVISGQHRQFKEVLTCIGAGVNVALVGPAGSGKTSAVKYAAEALGLNFYTKSVSAQTGSHEFFGYMDANGKYVKTLFRECYEKGGVFLLDEFDAGNPNVLAALNQATANGECAFADVMVDKHEDFIIVMCGNTFGHGANQEYVGRNKIDAATLDRFVFISFEYDEELEFTMAPHHKEWVQKVQRLRKMAEDKKVRAIISPRASIHGSKLLSAGMDEEMVLDLTVFKGLSQDEVTILKQAL